MTEEKRGYRSKASLEALPEVSELPTPPDPPDTLNEAGQRRWQELVNELSVDRFRKSDLVMLEQLIRCEQGVARMDRNIEENGEIIGRGELGSPSENPAVSVRDKLLRQMLSLQVKLRLCPSTRMRANKGELARGNKETKRPWS